MSSNYEHSAEFMQSGNHSCVYMELHIMVIKLGSECRNLL